MKRGPAVADPRFLLIDEEETFLSETAELLRGEGFACEVALGVEAGRAALDAGAFDVALLDDRMPGNAGLEMVEEIRQGSADLQVLIVTAYPTVAGAIGALRAEAIDYLIKPVDAGDLLQGVRRALAKGRAVRTWLRAQAELVAAARSILLLDGGVAPTRELASSLATSALMAPARRLEGGGGRGARQIEGPMGDVDGELESRLGRLSRRERQVLSALLSGDRVSVIAERYFVSPHTVRNHVKAIFRKLGVHSQVELLGRLLPVTRAESVG